MRSAPTTAALAATALSVLLVACGTTEAPVAIDRPPPSTTSTTTAPDTTASEALLAAACEGATEVTALGDLPADLDEVSGLVASRRHDGVLWAVEDSFEPAEVVALREDGTVIGTVGFTGAPVANLDWEDLALAPGPDGRDWLHVADIGDNLRFRRSVDLYRFPEPEPVDGVVEAEHVTATYETGPTDAEALVVTSGGTWIIGKVQDQAGPLYRLDEATSTFVLTGTTVDTGGDLVTAADVSPDGALLAVRLYDELRLHPLGPDGAVAGALATPGCSTAPPAAPPGESVALVPARRGVITVSEAPAGVATVHLVAPAAAATTTTTIE